MRDAASRKLAFILASAMLFAMLLAGGSLGTPGIEITTSLSGGPNAEFSIMTEQRIEAFVEDPNGFRTSLGACNGDCTLSYRPSILVDGEYLLIVENGTGHAANQSFRLDTATPGARERTPAVRFEIVDISGYVYTTDEALPGERYIPLLPEQMDVLSARAILSNGTVIDVTDEVPGKAEKIRGFRIMGSSGDKINAQINMSKGLGIRSMNRSIEIIPEGLKVKRLRLFDVEPIQLENRTLYLEDAPLSIKSGAISAYAIDPSGLNFTQGEMTMTAEGDILYKCREYNFSEQSCYGEWVRYMDIKPGEDYTVTLTPDDPAFAEGLEILNVQSYPAVGSRWTVRFETKGTADLEIRPVKGTAWETDLGFISLRCGEEDVDHEMINGSIYVEDYSCNETGFESSQVISTGRHHLEFSFGNFSQVAHNYAPYLQMEWGRLQVPCETWTEVELNLTYTNPIVVVSPEYKSTTNNYGIGVWTTNVTSNGFSVKASDSQFSCADTITVHYIVKEEGSWTLPGSGIRIQSGKLNTNKVGYRNGGWGCPDYGETVSFTETFSGIPLVLSSRGTDNNPTQWGVTFQHAPTATSTVTESGMCIGLNRNRISDAGSFTENETIYWIAADEGNGSLGDIEYEILWNEADTGDSQGLWINGYGDGGPFNQSYAHTWSSMPDVIPVSQSSVNGGDGSWAVLYDPANISKIQMFVDETSERAHGGSESGGGWAFSASGDYVDNYPPKILSPSFNVSETRYETDVNFTVWVPDSEGNDTVEYVNITLRNPDGTESNISLTQEVTHNIEDSGDLEPGIAGFIAQNSTIGETGALNISNNTWHTVHFSNFYEHNPVVIATVATDSIITNNTPIVTIREVTKDSFNITLCRDAGSATCEAVSEEETVHYFVFDVNKTKELDWIDTGWVTVQPDGTANTIEWNTSFTNAPYAFATANTYSQGGNIAATAWITGVSTTGATGFTGCTHQGTGDVCDSSTPEETFGYVALDPDSAMIESLQTGWESMMNSLWTPITFSPAYSEPRVMTLQNDENGTQDPQYPWARLVTTTSAEIRYCEMDGTDDCDTHNVEKMRWFALENGSILVNETNSIYDNETNTSWRYYLETDSTATDIITQITVRVNVSHYSDSGSMANGNNDPRLAVQLRTGTGWDEIGTITISGEGYRSISTTDQGITLSWSDYDNRDVRLRAIYMDYNSTSAFDSIELSAVNVSIDHGSVTSIWHHIFEGYTDIGRYSITDIRASDGMNVNSTVHNDLSFNITDRIPPVITYIDNITIQSTMPLSVDFDATDYSGVENWTVNDTDFRIDTSGLLENASPLAIRAYDLNISLYDTYDNREWEVIVVNSTSVPDTKPPKFAPAPGEINSSYGYKFVYDVNATDNSGILDEFWINDTADFRIDEGDGIIYNDSFLDHSYYDLNITVNDSSGNMNQTIARIHVIDTDAPRFAALADQYAEYMEAFSYGIGATDNLQLDSFAVNDSGFTISQTGLLENETVLALRNYSISISVNDTTNNTNTTVILIIVRDSTPPGQVKGLKNYSRGYDWISWNWTNPTDTDYDYNEIWLNRSYYQNTSADALNVTGLLPSRDYEISVRTVDVRSNINESWMNTTASTTFNSLPEAMLNSPEDLSAGAQHHRELNVTITDAETETLCLRIYGAEGSADRNSLIYRNCSVQNDSEITYNWSQLPLRPDSQTEALFHFNKQSTVGEHDTYVYDFAEETTDHNRSCSSGCPTFVENGGVLAGAYSYDGTSQYWLLDEQFFNDAFSQRTYIVWIKPDDLDGIQTIYDEGGATNGISFRLENDTLAYATQDSQNIYTLRYDYSDIQGWHMIAATYDSGNMSLYLDGILVNTTLTDTHYTSVGAHSDEGGIGASYNDDAFDTNGPQGDASNFFAGRIDEFMVKTSVLTSEEIRALYGFSYEETYSWIVNATDAYETETHGPWRFTVFEGDILGNESHVNASQGLNMTIQMNGTGINLSTDKYEDEMLVELFNGTAPLFSFQHNFSVGPLDLRTITSIVDGSTMVVEVPDHDNISAYLPVIDSVCNVKVCEGSTSECQDATYYYGEPDSGFCNITVDGTWASERPDLTDAMVNSSSISFTNSQPKEGENVTVSGTVYNNGTTKFKNLTVQFYDLTNSRQIGDDIVLYNFTENNITTVNASFIADIGETEIELRVDPPVATGGDYAEFDEGNNNVSASVEVSSWHTFYGNVLSNITFSDEYGNVAYTWSSELQAGNLYITDSDSEISWNNLTALGLDRTGASSSSDFSEADTNLGTASFRENITGTFSTDGTTARETRSLDIFRRAVGRVPVTNSTNTSSFFTGILWDSSDSSDDEYDAEAEDLVFVTRINESTQGAYGTYDYEIRVPAKLKDYKPGTQTVDVYIELV